MSSTKIEINYTTRVVGQTKESTILWTVPDFNKRLEKKTTREFRTEKYMQPAVLSKSQFQLKLECLGRENTTIDIYYLSDTPEILKITYSIRGYDYIIEKSVKEYHTVQVNTWQYLCTFSKQDAYNKSSRNLYIEITFTLKSDIKVDRFNNSQLSNDFENLLNSGLFSDVTIKSAEQSEYKVHKAVLTSRSPVLKAHFEHNTTECHTYIVESPFDSEVLREVLTFVYSEKAPRIDEIPEKLLSAADYYQLSGLKILCEEAVQKKLTVENAIETLQLADLYSANALKQLTLEFIKDRSNEITKTEGWSKVKDAELIKRIFEYILVIDDIDTDIELN